MRKIDVSFCSEVKLIWNLHYSLLTDFYFLLLHGTKLKLELVIINSKDEIK